MEEERIVYVGFSKHKHVWAVMSFLIRWWEFPKTWNPLTWFQIFFASHVFLIFPATKRRPFYMVSEAAGSSVRYMSQFNFEGHAVISRVYQLEFDKPTYDKMKTYSEQYAGNPYALLENAGIVISKIFRCKLNPFSDGDGEKSQKCSELVLRNAILRLPEVNMAYLRSIVKEDLGIELYDDINLIGVKDCHDILQSLAKRNVVKEIPQYAPLKII